MRWLIDNALSPAVARVIGSSGIITTVTTRKATKNSASPEGPLAPNAEDLKVFISVQQAACDECKEQLGRRAWITLNRKKGALCLSCGDLDHLVFLPSGEPAMTRRARKYSKLSAVVLRWSTARKRYERQGLLVEEAGLAKAEDECRADGEAHERTIAEPACLKYSGRVDRSASAKALDEQAVLAAWPLCQPRSCEPSASA